MNLYTKHNNKEFFNTPGLINKYPNCQFYIIVGQRSNGKSYSTLKYLIDEYFNKGLQFMYLRRFDENVKTRYMNNVFSDLFEYVELTYGYRIMFYNGCWYAIPKDEELKISNGVIIGYANSINNAEKLKSTSYPKVSYIIFEEFIATMGYINDEINLLMQIISTVFRDRTECKVLLLGNSISKTNPYTESLGISIKDFPKGKTQIINSVQGAITTSILIHRCKSHKKEKLNRKLKVGFTAFGQTNFGEMIHDGDFESRKGNRHINGVTFNELKYLVPNGIKARCPLNGTNIYITYLDIIYRVYLYSDGKNCITGFRKVNNLSRNTKILISNNTDYYSKEYKLITNINYLSLESNTSNYNKMVKLLSSLKNKTYITFNDDENEDIIKAFQSVGFMIE